MLRIEIRRDGDSHLEVHHARSSAYRVGRHTAGDLVLADPRVPRRWFELHLEPEGGFIVRGLEGGDRRVNSSIELSAGGTHLEIRDLRLLSDEKTLDGVKGRAWNVRHLGWIEAVVVFGLMLAQRLIQTEAMKSGPEVMGFVATLATGFLVVVGALSVVSKVLTGRFAWERMLRWLMEGLLVLTVIDGDFLGLRWWGFEWMKLTEFKDLAVIAVFGWMLWRLGREWFPGVSPRIRGALLTLLLGAATVHSLRHLLPRDDREHFVRRDPMPILPTLLLPGPISTDDYLQDLEKKLNP